MYIYSDVEEKLFLGTNYILPPLHRSLHCEKKKKEDNYFLNVSFYYQRYIVMTHGPSKERRSSV